MRQLLSFLFLLLAGTSSLVAQTTSLPVPQEITAAIEAQTRSWNGAPGPRYFQNHTDYRIQARLNPTTDSLFGSLSLTYHNDSPDALDQLVIRLYQDMYKAGFDADDPIKRGDQTTGTAIYRMTHNGRAVDLGAETERKGTNLFFRLSEPLQPGSQCTLEIDWAFSIPNESLIRMGKYYEGAYFIAYWYPQMAVYDDVFGWDVLDYGGTVEFYNDFGSFDLALTVPEEYLVWSTGLLQNADELLAEPFLSRYRKAWESDEVVKIVNKEEAKEARITQPGQDGWHTWRFQAGGVPDAAFAVAKNYLWDATSVAVGEPGRRVLTEACYRPAAKDFYEVAGYGQEVVRDLSTNIPGIPFPYPKITVFHGDKSGGGMEYPMMVNDASVFSPAFAFSLTYHEIAHTYFPFYMGINERRYAWMDEGWATFLPEDLMVKKGYQKEPLRFTLMSYNAIAGTPREKALMTPSYELSGMAYGVASYPKPGLAYFVLRDVLGEDLFKSTLRGYMDRWAGKHPGPYDFFLSFNDLSGQNLDWYWKPWFFETLKPDLAINPVQIKGKRANLEVVNAGGLPLPVHLTIKFTDGTEQVRHFSAAVWANGEKSFAFDERFEQKIKSVELGAGWIPDVNSGDNTWKP